MADADERTVSPYVARVSLLVVAQLPERRLPARCAPMALAPLIVRWGPDASSDTLRCPVRCSRCGRKGATLQHPGWAGSEIGMRPFPSVS
jgi:hypothetical protein